MIAKPIAFDVNTAVIRTIELKAALEKVPAWGPLQDAIRQNLMDEIAFLDMRIKNDLTQYGRYEGEAA